MLNSGNDNKPFSLVNIIEEQLNNISFSSGNFNLETDSSENTNLLAESDNGQALKTKNESFDHDNKEIGALATSEVHWFYKNTGKTWIEFSGYDSIQLENAYRKILEEWPKENGDKAVLLTSETKSALENEKENKESQTTDHRRGSQEASSSRRSSQSNKHILVRGGLYEADILSRKCASIYWPGKSSF